MTDDEFIAAFEDCSLPAEQFTHSAHVRAAYIYAARHDLETAIDRMRSGLQRYNKAQGTPEAIDRGYHETITQAFMQLVYLSHRRSGPYHTAQHFCEANPALLTKHALRRFYSRERLMTWEAKAGFLEPDLAPLSAEALTATPDRLVIFDVDGTLIQSIGLDDRCFVQAVSDVLGVGPISTDWASYQYQTDSGLIFEIASKHSGEPPAAGLTRRVRSHFLHLLALESKSAGFSLLEVPGASAMLATLRQHPSWCAAIATGGWEAAARLKLEQAGVNVENIPLASSDDAMPREEIIECAIQRAMHYQGQSRFEKIVYVGDGSWDAAAARRLRIGFVGVSPVETTTFDGHPCVVTDFADPPAFLRMLDSVFYPPQNTLRNDT